MLRHGDIWNGLDRLARAHGLTPSGLAKRAGLDPTTFNKSKRVTRDGKLRWPSTESVAKVLDATGQSLPDFVAFVTGGAPVPASQRLPLARLDQLGEAGMFTPAGRPAGAGWDEISFPEPLDEGVFAIEVAGEAGEPCFRDGDFLVVSPEAALRRGDRVVMRTRDGEVLIHQLVRRTARRVELRPLDRAMPQRDMAVEDIDWINRIIWASQ